MAGPVFQTETHGNINGATLTLNVPSGTVNGDLLIACLNCRGDLTITDPAGWTVIATTASGTATTDVRFRTYWRQASSEPASYNFVTTGGAISKSGFIWRINAADTVTPIHKSSSVTGTGATATATGVTTTINDTLIIYLGGYNSTTLNSWPAPSTMTNRTSELGGQAETTGSSKALGTAAATGNFSATTNATAGEPYALQLLAIAPSSANVSVALLTNASTLAVGTASKTNERVITGTSLTSAVGTVDYLRDFIANTTGVSLTSDIGSVTTSRTVSIIGASSTSTVGNITFTAPVTHGLQANTALGNLGVTLSKDPIVGVSSNTAIENITVVGQSVYFISSVVSTSEIGLLAVSIELEPLTTVQDSSAVGNLSAIPEDIVALSGNSLSGSTGTIGVINPTTDIALVGGSISGDVGSVVYFTSSLILNVSGIQALISAGNIITHGGHKQGGSNTTQYHKLKKNQPQVDLVLKWKLRVIGSEEEYLGPKIREYYPEISENMLSNTMNNIITMMQSFFDLNPKLILQKQIDQREEEVIMFWSLVALKQHNTNVQYVAPYRPGMLG